MFLDEENRQNMVMNLSHQSIVKKWHTLRELNNKSIKICAHRGSGPTSHIQDLNIRNRMATENTIKSLKEAIISGVDGIELDVFKTLDNHVVVIHSDQLWLHVEGIDRTGTILPESETKETFIVGKKNYEDLKKLKIGPHDNDVIPELKEILDLVEEANQVRKELGLEPLLLNIDFKNSKIKQQGESQEDEGIDQAYINNVVKYTLKEIEEYSTSHNDSGICLDNTVFCSFNHEALQYLFGLNNKVKISKSVGNAILFGEGNVDATNYSLIKESEGFAYFFNGPGVHNIMALLDSNIYGLDTFFENCSTLDLNELVKEAGKVLFVTLSDPSNDNFVISPFSLLINFLIKNSNNIPIVLKCAGKDFNTVIELLIEQLEVSIRKTFSESVYGPHFSEIFNREFSYALSDEVDRTITNTTFFEDSPSPSLPKDRALKLRILQNYTKLILEEGEKEEDSLYRASSSPVSITRNHDIITVGYRSKSLPLAISTKLPLSTESSSDFLGTQESSNSLGPLTLSTSSLEETEISQPASPCLLSKLY